MKVILKAPFSEYSGYGQDGIGLAKALLRFGADLYLAPAHVDAPLPTEVRDLLGKRLEAPFDLLIQHQDPNFLGLTPQERIASEITVGATMWEFSDMSNLPEKKTLRDRLRTLDIYLPYDDVTAGATEPYLKEPRKRRLKKTIEGLAPEQPKAPLPIMRKLQGGYDPDLWTKVRRDWNSERFGFCMLGALRVRKDPFVAVEAFRQLKDEKGKAFAGAELHLKDSSGCIHPGMSDDELKLRIHSGSWPMSTIQKFYELQHVMVCPSRGEGKNLPPLEFMTTGGAVIATNWSGHKEWISEEYAYPLDYVLRPFQPEYKTCMNARASVEHMKHLMWHTFTHRDEVAKKAELASQVIPQKCNWDQYVSTLVDHCLRLPVTGQRLAKAMMRAGLA